ncbi:MAG: hydantoinase/oxoprolinase family protein [Gammaproteobacteria bacterium]|nr:hydantoinase/oxoprolinase family protein [Gammaproteobacteria bacterium]
MNPAPGPRLAVDIGGTFTDIVVAAGGRLCTAKVPTTAAAPARGFLDGAAQLLAAAGIAPAGVASIIHGTTLATNALIERRGARTALVTTAGFRDSLEIAAESRFDQYDMFLQKPAPLVPRRRRLTVPERVGPRGEVLRALTAEALESLLPRIEAARVESVAVGFLHAYANPAHERMAGEFIAKHLPGVAVSLSAEVCPELREYERLSTTVANAYVQPSMAKYLGQLRDGLDAAGFRCPLLLMTSAGGMTTLQTALKFPIRLVESGPSGGAILARHAARQCGARMALSYDMGGTTAKICLLEAFAPRTARQFEVARSARFMAGSGLPVRIPVTEMIEIGAGGGSKARIDALGRLAVGPQSAGADPGPACYGRGGTDATVTDADCVLGRLDRKRFAEGRIALRADAAERAIDLAVARPLGLSVAAAAAGIGEMVDETMANAARVHAAEHGADLSRCALIAFGGCGPLHAAQLARKLGIRRVIVPTHPGVGSALGFLRAAAAYEMVRSLHMRLSAFDADAVNRLYSDLSSSGREVVSAAAPGATLTERRGALMRYPGQGHEVDIDMPAGALDAESAAEIRRRFEAHYARIYGRILPNADIEALSWSLTVAAPAPVLPDGAVGDDGDGHGDGFGDGDGVGDGPGENADDGPGDGIGDDLGDGAGDALGDGDKNGDRGDGPGNSVGDGFGVGGDAGNRGDVPGDSVGHGLGDNAGAGLGDDADDGPPTLVQRATLRPGDRVPGPAQIAEPQTTTVLPPNCAATVDHAGNLIIDFDAPPAA